jgi:hypothetical protein
VLPLPSGLTMVSSWFPPVGLVSDKRLAPLHSAQPFEESHGWGFQHDMLR